MSVKAILTEQQKSYTKAEEDALLATKQNTLTFDTTPTASSTNPVTSGGIATALDGRLPSPENAGAVGQVLTRTATGSVWQTQSSGGDIVAAASNSYAVTLYAANWSNQQQTIATPSGAEITSTSDGVLGLAAGATQAQVEAFQLAKIVVVSQSSSGVVVKAYGIVPTINLPCELMLFMKADYYTKDYIDTYMAPLDTPTFVGVPKAPTAAAGTNTTQIATTAFVEQAKNTRVPVYGLGKNLLRNWYFVGGGTGRGIFPVNSRGQTSYLWAGGDFRYAMDGWRGAYPQIDLTLISSGLQITYVNTSQGGNLDQQINLVSGLTYTASALTSLGLSTSTVTVSSTISSTTPSLSTTKFRMHFSPAQLNCIVYAVKVELGDQQTLCHNEGTDANPVWVLNDIPDYEYELYRCMTSTADSSDTYANKTFATEQQLAYIETGPTASRAYTAREYFCWNGLLYRAKTAISSGSSFTVGTNCEVAPDGGLNRVRDQVIINRQSLASSISSGLNTLEVTPSSKPGYVAGGIVGVQFPGADRTKISLVESLIDPSTGNITIQFNSTYNPSSSVGVVAFVLYIKI